MCHFTEYVLARVHAGGSPAWCDTSALIVLSGTGVTEQPVTTLHSPKAGRYAGNAYSADCAAWSDGTALGSGSTISGNTLTNLDCATARPIACCNSPYPEVFRGFTAATVSGAQGGYGGMNAICHAEFPNSHLCHGAEYFRSAPKKLASATGAWLQPSAVPSHDATVFLTYSGFAEAGLYFAGNGNDCTDWNSISIGNISLVATPQGFNVKPCSEAHPLACCGP